MTNPQFLFTLLVLVTSQAFSAQATFGDGSTVKWIVPPAVQPKDYGVFMYRRTVELDTVPSELFVDVTADQRYRLFVNGEEVSMGPCAGNLNRWRYETVDLAPYLRPGKNAVSALVWNMGPDTPAIQISHRTAFRLKAHDDDFRQLDSNHEWRVAPSLAYSPLPVDRQKIPYYCVIGPGDSVDGSKFPWGWESPEFDDRDWQSAAEISDRDDTPWVLAPRDIDVLESTISSIGKVRKAEGIDIAEGADLESHQLTIPANTTAMLLIDHGVLTNAYPQLSVRGGKNAEITLTYAESLWEPRQAQNDQSQHPDFPSDRKGNRDEIEGKVMVGLQDRFRPDGGSNRGFQPVWFRTFRYVQMDIKTADEPLTIEGFSSAFTGYPLEQKAWFKSDDPSLGPLSEVAWRTLRLCANETMYDCPFYERLQYVGDTRTQACFMRYLSGDDALPRRAIQDFADSIGSDGITQSRYPCNEFQSIPPYSLFWISMLHDDYRWRGDIEFIRKFADGIESVLKWHEGYLDDDGMLLLTPGWRFVDWTFPQVPGDPHAGVPEGDDKGRSSVGSLQLAYTYQQAAELMHALGETDKEKKYRDLSERIKSGVMKLCWDVDKKCFADSTQKKAYSQHGNILAILTKTVPPDQQRELLEIIMNDKSLIATTVYFRFYLNRVLEQLDAGDQYLGTLGPWHDMLKVGLTTFAEMPEPTRSDCHAWGSSPPYEFLRIVAGIRESSPGFKKVEIAPRFGELKSIDAGMPTPQGTVSVKLTRNDDHSVNGNIDLPNGVTGNFRWRGKTIELHAGANPIGQ